jgi:hypothetical protein
MNPRTRSRSRWLWILVPIIAIIGISLLILSRNNSASSADPLAAVRAKASDAAQGLDILQVEYPKTLRGETSGAPGAFSRARNAFNDARSDLEKIDSGTVSQLAANFNALQKLIDSKAPAELVITLAQGMESTLLGLAKAK